MNELSLLTPLELVLGRPLGFDPGAPPLPEDDPSVSARSVLADTIREALHQPPCLIMFSGGRDSSAVLSASVSIARELGLEAPVPFTLRFPGVLEADERTWQEQVVRHLGVDEWVRREIDDELDLLGPFARSVLVRHGSIWPPNAFVLAIAAEEARGGTVLTGSFGDEMFTTDTRMQHARAALSGEAPLRVRDALKVGLARSPAVVRRYVARRRYVRASDIPPWVADARRSRAMAVLADDLAALEVRWDRDVLMAWRRRYTQVVRRGLDLLAADAGSRLVSPFGDPRFRVAFARFGGSRGFRSRTEAMQALFEGMLPEEVIRRGTKASFGGVFWGQTSFGFVRDWSGTGLDPSWVDIEALKRRWRWDPDGEARPDFRSAALLQAAWLASEGHVTPLSPTH